jgi:adenylosuccinate synthase
MTKADVLDDFETLRMCTQYRIAGKETEEIPFQMLQQSIEPVLSTFAGWKKDITTKKDFQSLPEEMKTYISFIDSYLKVKVSYISNGPGRSQLIEKQ